MMTEKAKELITLVAGPESVDRTTFGEALIGAAGYMSGAIVVGTADSEHCRRVAELVQAVGPGDFR